MKNPSAAKLNAQINACAEVLAQVFNAVMNENRPADRALHYVFKKNRKFGSRDRRLIAESIFAVFRWLGWLRNLAEAGIIPDELNQKTTRLFLVGAWCIEKNVAPEIFAAAVKAIDKSINHKNIWFLDDPQKRLQSLIEQLNIGDGAARQSDQLQLLPAWACSECPQLTKMSWREFQTAFQSRPPIFIRHQGNPKNQNAIIKWLESQNATFHSLPKPFKAIAIDECGTSLYESPLFKAGAFEVQDAASQIIGIVCAPKPGERWWDCCAGAGGKTMQLADMMKNSGLVLASDIRERKLKDAKLRARRAQFSNVSCKPWNGSKIPGREQSFDGVLVDAPCTCSGTWRRNPDGRWTTTQKDVQEMHDIQLQLLESAKKAVRPGGALVYATCSIFPKENQNVINEFLKNNPDFQAEPFPHPLTNEQVENGTLQIWHWQMDSDSLFVAKMRRH